MWINVLDVLLVHESVQLVQYQVKESKLILLIKQLVLSAALVL
jgi:hypothetical protein